MKRKVDKLESTLETFTRGRNSLDNILDSKKAMFDKSGLGYGCSSSKLTNRYNNVPYNYSTPSSSKTRFIKSSNYHRTKCMHCSRFNHASYKCPNRFRIPSYMKWVSKSTNNPGPNPT